MPGQQVLIVDDEVGLLNLFAGLVERLRYDTIRAQGGQAALDVLAQTIPDLLILDLAMPGISGIDVLYYILDRPQLAAMKIIVLTALGFSPEMEAIETRIDLWLNRPIMPHDFIHAVQQVMGQ